jgi:D-beta-D-heptose 7-phosphate kinase / D-beta-D-heptose 1-phosphate adenosyltransferase
VSRRMGSAARPLVVVGDALLDLDLEGRVERLCPDAPAAPVVDNVVERPRPGGAALAATLARLHDRREVVLVTALADDAPGRLLAGLLADAGVAVIDLGLDGDTPEKVRVRTGGYTLLRMDRGGSPGAVGRLPSSAWSQVAGAGAVLVADYGRGVAAEPGVRAALEELAGQMPLAWDPHPKGPAPVPGARLVTPNRSEAALLARSSKGEAPPDDVAEQARVLAARWCAERVAVTLGSRGAVVAGPSGPPLRVPARPVRAADPCGAGDRFASAAAGLLAEGAGPPEAAAGAVDAASAFIAAGGVATLEISTGAVVLPYRSKEVFAHDSG